MQRTRMRPGFFLAGVAVGLLTASAFFATCGHDATTVQRPAPTGVQVARAAPGRSRPRGKAGFVTSFAEVATAVVPSVVNIHSTKIVRSMPMLPSDPFFLDPFLRRFFGRPMRPMRPMERRIKSLGSGVIISSDGYIVTNFHVIAQADRVKVALPDKRVFEARVKGKDPRTDLALLKIDAKGLKPIAIGDSSKLRVGDVVLAVGNPFGVGETVTMGIVSAVGRAGMGITDYEDFIQTDAAINPGNSGGALVNVRGELVGIPTAIVSRSGGYQGIGFAVPTSLAMPVIESLKKHGKVVRGYLGVRIQELTPSLAKAMKVRAGKGVVVVEVEKGSAAEKAGLKSGDVIVSLDGRPVESLHRFRNSIAVRGRGAKVRLGILRNGKRVDVTAVLGELPSAGPVAVASRPKGGKTSAWSGVEVEPLTPQWRRRLGVPDRVQGVVVTKVASGSLAAAGGLMEGDVILEVNRHPVRDVRSFLKYAKGSSALVKVWRRGMVLFLGWAGE